jgi:hypothetical protein
MASNFVPQIDYTSRDYAAIRDEMIALIPTFLPEWTTTDASDFGITLIELFAYMGDSLNYYIDRAANEGFITTATQRSSVLAIANLLGYTPSNGTPAATTLTFSNSTASTVSMPAKTQIATTTTVNGVSTQIIFETDATVVIPAAVGATKGTISAPSTQGETITSEYLGDSNGTAYQTFSLANTPLISGTTQIVINSVAYTRVDYLIDSNGNDPVYTVNTDAEGVSYINFGDNVSGRIPPIGAVYATYRIGGGTSGNVGPSTLKYLITNVVAGVTVNNATAASGGADPESTDTIRINAPTALTALNRAVSLKDYAALSIQISSVAKAIADATSFNNVSVYIAPYGDLSLGTPGVDVSGDPTATFTNAAATLEEFLTDKVPPTTSVTIFPPVYVPINVSLTLHILPQYRQTTVQDAAYAAINALFSFDNTFFAEEVVLQYIHSAVSSVNGVLYADVTLLTRADAVFTGNLTAASATITSVSDFTNVAVGQKLAVTGGTVTIPTGTIVSAFDAGAATITLSTNTGGSSSTSGASLSVIGVNTITCLTNEIPKAGVITIAPVGGLTL